MKGGETHYKIGGRAETWIELSNYKVQPFNIVVCRYSLRVIDISDLCEPIHLTVEEGEDRSKDFFVSPEQLSNRSNVVDEMKTMNEPSDTGTLSLMNDLQYVEWRQEWFEYSS